MHCLRPFNATILHPECVHSYPAGSITRATSLPHFLQEPRKTRELPHISPSRSRIVVTARHCPHQTLSMSSFWSAVGICCHRLLASAVNTGSCMTLECFSVIFSPMDYIASLGFTVHPFAPTYTLCDSHALPRSANRYFCNRLFGFSGMVISINPAASAGAR